jgi:hypothetical protein
LVLFRETLSVPEQENEGLTAILRGFSENNIVKVQIEILG